MVRVISGSARGRRLQVPPGEVVRPTADRVREALFSALAHRLPGPWAELRVLDLFGGAGTLGLEARSRGAKEVRFVEANAKVAKVLRANAEAVGGPCHVTCAQVETYLRGPSQPFDVVFLDPPYRKGHEAPTLAALLAGDWLTDEAIVIVEHAVDDPITAPPGLTMIQTRRYGGTALTLLEPSPTENAQ